MNRKWTEKGPFADSQAVLFFYILLSGGEQAEAAGGGKSAACEVHRNERSARCAAATIEGAERSVRNWVERLVRCGIPEGTARTIVDFFFKRRRTMELIAYVRMTEEATGK